MAPTKARKRTPKAPDLIPLNTLINTITLGEEEAISAPIPPLNPTLTIKRTDESLYPLEPLISNNTKQSFSKVSFCILRTEYIRLWLLQLSRSHR